MKIQRKAVWIAMGFVLACSALSALCAEGSGEPAAAASPGAAEVARRVDDMQKEIDRLRGELGELRKQLNGSTANGAAPATATAVPASPTAASATPGPVAPAAVTPQAAKAPASFLSTISLSGTVDGYYGYNFNHPRVAAPLPSPTGGPPFTNFLRAFDGRSQQLALNLAELNVDKTPETNSRLGFHLAFGYGDAMNVVNSNDPGNLGFAQYLKEGYFSYLAPVGKGLQVDFGKFVTQHGAEVIETKDNWTYSRSLLFTFAIPFYHFGLRAKYPLSDKYTLSGYIVNGWNNIVDNNTGKTFGVQLVGNPTKKINFVQNYMLGPEQAGTNDNWRHLIDTTVTYLLTSKLSLMTNFDYGREKPCGIAVAGNPCPSSSSATALTAWWSGIAQYAKYQFDDATAVVVRYEYFNDHNNYAFSAFNSTGLGLGRHVNEFTGTFERIIAKHLITRWEFRRDESNRNLFFDHLVPSDRQNTVMGGLIYVFDSKEK